MDLFVQKKQRENMRDELRKMISEYAWPKRSCVAGAYPHGKRDPAEAEGRDV